MQSEELDKKVREAADHHHPAYDETAWSSMEKLLDVHLPQKKDDRRRFIFFLLFFLLLAGGSAMFFIARDKKKPGNVAATDQEPTKQTNNTTPASGKQETIPINEDNNEIPVVTNQENETAGNNNSSGTTNTIFQQPVSTRVQFISGAGTAGRKQKNNKGLDPVNNTDQNPDIFGLAKTPDKSADNNTKPATGIDLTTRNTEPVKKNGEETTGNNVTPPVSKEEKNTIPEPVAKETKAKAKSKKTNSFAFTFSAGPDVSAAGADKLGRTKLLAGLGFQYTIKDRFSIRTGFYSSRKVYSASAAEYHAPPAFYTYYPYLEKVDADCKVYEIPLSVTYNFSRSARKNWFVSTGLSSYLMKKETYNYYYKTSPTGTTRTREYTLLDQNKHYFSVMTISGGYQRTINKSISLTAEPYVKLPLSGVGYGKVDLNSAGIMFTLGIKPFHQKKEKK